MIRTVFSKALLISCFAAGTGLAYAQGTATTPDTAIKPSGTVAQTPAQTPSEQLTDSQITSIVLTANEAEINQGKLAEKTTKNKEVGQFAKQMVTDHTNSQKEVKDLNAKMKVKEQSSLVRNQLESAIRNSDSRLKNKKDAEFDKAYIEEQVIMHQAVLDTIDTHLSPNAKSPEVKNLLSKTRITVASHLDHAKLLQNTKPAM